MKYFIVFILYCIIAGIIAGIALRNHDEKNENFDDVAKPELIVAIICVLPALLMIMAVGAPLAATYAWMRGVHKK